MSVILDFRIPGTDNNPGCTVPKARPRENGRLPKNYSDWKNAAGGWLIRNVIRKNKGKITLPLTNVGVCILFSGTLRGNADLDNGVGSWLDALQDVEILANDNVLAVPVEYCRFIRKPKTKKEKLLLPNFKLETRILIVETDFIDCPFRKADTISYPQVEKIADINVLPLVS